MNFRKLLIHWSKLSAILILLVIGHIALHSEGADPLARATLPAMPDSKIAAEQKLQSMLAAHDRLDFSDIRMSDKIYCNTLNDSSAENFEAARYSCFEQKLQELTARAPTITDAYEALKSTYEYQVVEPRVKLVQYYVLPWGFGMLYALVALSALRALWQWIKCCGFPALSRNIDESPLLGQIAPKNLSKTVQTWTGDRAYRKAAEEVMQLETLHKNGLISDEVFHLRKSVLAARLNLHSNAPNAK